MVIGERPLLNKSEHPSQGFRQSLQANHRHFIQYDWQSKLQTLNDYMAEMAMLG